MQVQENDVAAIILTLLAERNVRPGGHITPDELARHWRDVGLRRDDLDRGVSILLRDGFLMEEELPSQPQAYMLTRAGYRHMDKVVSPLRLGLGRDQRLRRRAHKRQGEQDGKPTEPPVGERRRNPPE